MKRPGQAAAEANLDLDPSLVPRVGQELKASVVADVTIVGGRIPLVGLEVLRALEELAAVLLETRQLLRGIEIVHLVVGVNRGPEDSLFRCVII
jgi:hypothetical protein